MMTALDWVADCLYPRLLEGAGELWVGLFTRALIPFMRVPPKAPPPNTITLGVSVPTREVGARKAAHQLSILYFLTQKEAASL